MRRPSYLNTALNRPSQSRSALRAIVSNTGCASVGVLEMTRRISPVAVCCSCASTNSRLRVWSCSCDAALSLSASARRFSRSRTLAPSSLGMRATGGLACLDLAGFGPRPISLPLTPMNRPGTGEANPPVRARGPPSGCREHMICPLFVASDLSAVRAVASQSVGREGQHALSAGGPGAGHDDSRGGAAGDERRDHLDPGGGDHRVYAAQFAALAWALCA